MRQESAFSVDVQQHDGTVGLLLTGELDVATAPILRTAIDSILTPQLREVTFDMRHVAFVDVVGLRAILDARHAVADAGAQFCLQSVSDLTRRVIRLLHFAELDDTLQTV